MQKNRTKQTREKFNQQPVKKKRPKTDPYAIPEGDAAPDVDWVGSRGRIPIPISLERRG